MIPHYLPPTADDIAVVICYFNPVGYLKPYMNYLLFRESMQRAKIPLFIAELVIGAADATPVIPDAHLTLRSKHAMFYKEHLWNRCVSVIPTSYSKLCFCDADIIFTNPNWINDLSRKLETCDMVQPFTTCQFLDRDYKTPIWTRGALLHALETGAKPALNDAHHPGYAMAYRRDFFTATGGIFEHDFVGSGDTALANALLGTPFRQAIYKAIGEPYAEYAANLARLKPRLGAIPGTVKHLYHGSKTNRNYVDRYAALLGRKASVPLSGLLRANDDGIPEFIDPTDADRFLTYFKSRKEDD